jgi:CRP/FNR family transcriptional regulator, cyclic AMP receptor protein
MAVGWVAVAKASKELEYLATVPLFSALSRPELRQVVQSAEELDVDAGYELVTEGRVGREFFLILSGQAVVRRGGRKVVTLGPGQWFGELALIDNEPRSATVVAATDMKLLLLGQAEFGGLLESIPGIAAKLLNGMAHRLRAADARAVSN